MSDASGETETATLVLAELSELRDTVVETKYQHRTKVRRRDGYYAWDCSGMANWILRRTSRKAYRALRQKRPRAKHYYSAIN